MKRIGIKLDDWHSDNVDYKLVNAYFKWYKLEEMKYSGGTYDMPHVTFGIDTDSLPPYNIPNVNRYDEAEINEVVSNTLCGIHDNINTDIVENRMLVVAVNKNSNIYIWDQIIKNAVPIAALIIAMVAIFV